MNVQPGREDPAQPITLQVSTAQRPEFKHPLVACVFDRRGQLAQRAEVRDGQVQLSISPDTAGRMRLFIAPMDERVDAKALSIAQLERLRAYEPVLQWRGPGAGRIDIPGSLIDFWPFCFCWVRGRVLRANDNRPVCDARVHICEVDRIPLWILKLPDLQIYRLRDDLLQAIRRPPIPRPLRPGPGPLRAEVSTLRFADWEAACAKGADVQAAQAARASADAIALTPELQAQLHSQSPVVLRHALAQHWKLLLPWFCIWPHWWWLFRCDEIAVITTDGNGRFETTVFYPCGGDHPDLYFWVEYDFGSGFETIYHPRIGCHTHWNYACGSEVTIHITDPRVPGCGDEPDLPGCEVVVLSIGRNVAVREVQAAGTEGLTSAGEPFGATLEPRVDFSRSELINGKGIPYYRWSYRRLSGPDGSSAVVDPASVPLNTWAVMTRDVYRHYKLGTSFPSDLMGPLPTSGPGAAPAPNLFRIRPPMPPAGDEWVVLNESIDLATAYFETATLAGAPTGPAPLPDDLAAGRYELKLELFDAGGALVNWTAAGIDLRTTDQDAPFGTGTVTTSPAPAYNRILAGGDTMGFRMVVRVDNNRCSAEILPVGGTVTPDPVCGFHNYSLPSDTAALSFVARHPNGFATYSFVTTRGSGPVLPAATTSGTAGAPGNGGFVNTGSFTYEKAVVVSTLLGVCSNAAFSERLDVMAMATNGYGTLTGYNAADNAAFALATPCPSCEGEVDA